VGVQLAGSPWGCVSVALVRLLCQRLAVLPCAVMLGASLREWHRSLALAQWRAFLVAGLWLLFGFL
jgi:hypothetical protein